MSVRSEWAPMIIAKKTDNKRHHYKNWPSQEMSMTTVHPERSGLGFSDYGRDAVHCHSKAIEPGAAFPKMKARSS